MAPEKLWQVWETSPDDVTVMSWQLSNLLLINGKKYDRNLSYKPKLGIHCTVSEMLFNSNSYCMSESSAMWSQSSWFMCSQCLVQLSATTWVLSQSHPVGPCGPSWLLTVVDKDLFESSEAGLFASNNANKAEACCLVNLCYPAETSK